MRIMLLSMVGAPGRPVWLLIVVVLLTAGCWSAPEGTVQPRDGRAGLQLTGTVGGRQLAVSDGAPDLRAGDCDPDVDVDEDVCVLADDINGELVVLVFENPDVLVSGVTLPVADPGCGDHCDDVSDVAVVDLQLDTGPRMRAHGGRLDIREVTPFLRYVGEVRLELPSGTASGSFDVVPRSD